MFLHQILALLCFHFVQRKTLLSCSFIRCNRQNWVQQWRHSGYEALETDKRYENALFELYFFPLYVTHFIFLFSILSFFAVVSIPPNSVYYKSFKKRNKATPARAQAAAAAVAAAAAALAQARACARITYHSSDGLGSDCALNDNLHKKQVIRQLEDQKTRQSNFKSWQFDEKFETLKFSNCWDLL